VADQLDALLENVAKFEAQIGIKSGFLASLLNDGDDWSFIIKAHALAEAALTDLLTAGVGREELRDVFSSLSMGDSRIGKLALAERLQLLDPGRRAFFRALGRVRNQFVHDIKKAGLGIADFANTLEPAERTQFLRDLMRGHTRELVIVDGERSVPTEEFVATRPRFAIWISAMSALELIYQIKSLDQATRTKIVAELTALKPLRKPTRRPKNAPN
jgi:hypothetical protein